MLTSLPNYRTVTVNTTVANVSQQLKSWKEIPGLSMWNLIRQALPGAKGDLNVKDWLNLGPALYNNYGPIVKLDGFLGKRPSSTIVLLYDPEECAHILRSENWLPSRPGFESLDYYRRNKSKTILASKTYGLFTDNGETWKKFRSTVNPMLLQPKTIKLYTAMIDEVSKDMIARMKSLRGEDNMIKSDFYMEMNLWSLESLALIALGRRLRCFDSNLPPNSPEKRLIQLAHEIFKTMDQLDFKPSLWRYYPTKAFKRAMKLYEEQETIARFFLDKSIKELEIQGSRKTDDEKSVLEKLLEINKDVAVVMVTDLMFGGVDTTSNTITATLYLLANNQDKQDKLREEIRCKKNSGEKLYYLGACIKEGMRIMPVAIGNMRRTTKEYNVLGYEIPIGTDVVFMHQAMSMMEKHFPRAEEFLPERWLAEKVDPLYHGNAHPFVYQPFGFGVRSCIGRRIAELELDIFISRLIDNFKVEWFGPPMQTKVSSLNYTVGPYNFIFKDA